MLLFFVSKLRRATEELYLIHHLHVVSGKESVLFIFVLIFKHGIRMCATNRTTITPILDFLTLDACLYVYICNQSLLQ